MSLTASPPNEGDDFKHGRRLFKLTGVSTYSAWINDLQDIIFALSKNTDMSKLSRRNMMDPEFLAKDERAPKRKHGEAFVKPVTVPKRRSKKPIEVIFPVIFPDMEALIEAREDRARKCKPGSKISKALKATAIAEEARLQEEFDLWEVKSEARVVSVDPEAFPDVRIDSPMSGVMSEVLENSHVDFCFSKALDTGLGFHPWVYRLWQIIRGALSSEISLQTSGVRRGDIPSLLQEIKLAIGFTETADATDLEIAYSASSMAVDGENDLLKFTSHLRRCIARLTAVDQVVPDKKKQRAPQRIAPGNF